ncbi:hypothetical protein VNO77_21192 [Canavalia gladiata]|uniref:Uncharacterized protein n=1 Tax=Canavalia gladiata TaxID=3824 RepID=A0AAN9QM28_CANGL
MELAKECWKLQKIAVVVKADFLPTLLCFVRKLIRLSEGISKKKMMYETGSHHQLDPAILFTQVHLSQLQANPIRN